MNNIGSFDSLSLSLSSLSLSLSLSRTHTHTHTHKQTNKQITKYAGNIRQEDMVNCIIHGVKIMFESLSSASLHTVGYMLRLETG